MSQGVHLRVRERAHLHPADSHRTYRGAFPKYGDRQRAAKPRLRHHRKYLGVISRVGNVLGSAFQDRTRDRRSTPRSDRIDRFKEFSLRF